MIEGQACIIFLCTIQTHTSVKHTWPLPMLMTNMYVTDAAPNYFTLASTTLENPEMTIFQGRWGGPWA